MKYWEFKENFRNKWYSFWLPKRPISDTSEGWNIWEKKMKKQYPIGFFMAWTLPGKLKRGYRILITDPIWWVKHRTFWQYHYIPSGLEPGFWDYDHLLEETIFNVVKLHVNAEMWKHEGWDKIYKKSKEEKAKFINEKLQQFIEKLKNSEFTSQYEAEKEIYDIYKWITTVRDIRKDSFEDSGLAEFCKKSKKLKSPEYRRLMDKMTEIEDQYKKEDEEMIYRIIKIRNCLWS